MKNAVLLLVAVTTNAIFLYYEYWLAGVTMFVLSSGAVDPFESHFSGIMSSTTQAFLVASLVFMSRGISCLPFVSSDHGDINQTHRLWSTVENPWLATRPPKGNLRQVWQSLRTTVRKEGGKATEKHP
jgi:hypothetical protein